MTKIDAIRVATALQNIQDFEVLYDEIKTACDTAEGNFADFLHHELYPLLDKELKRHNRILEDIQPFSEERKEQ